MRLDSKDTFTSPPNCVAIKELNQDWCELASLNFATGHVSMKEEGLAAYKRAPKGTTVFVHRNIEVQGWMSQNMHCRKGNLGALVKGVWMEINVP